MRRNIPLWISLIVYWLLSFVLLSTSISITQGHFGYPIDDTYIHMAIGKHFVNNGSWGVSQTGFSSTTSSPLWTFLIALSYKIFTVEDWIPFILCLLCGNLIIIESYRLLKEKTNNLRLTVILLLIIIITPLPILTLIGMEHVLHGFVTILLLYQTASYFSRKEQNRRQLIAILLLASLLTMTRYEGLFLILAIIIMFIIKKHYSVALLIAGAAILPIAAYGIYSVNQGWYFLPNSILLKGNFPTSTLEGISLLLSQWAYHLTLAPHLLVLMVACLGVYLIGSHQNVFGQKEKFLIAVFVITTLLHVHFAGIGWFYRYEAYLVLTGSLLLVDMLSHETFQAVKINKLSNGVAVITLIIFIMTPLAVRAGQAFGDYAQSVLEIFETQYQMGLFLREYYSGKDVALNDIGAVNYLADLRTLDVLGLGSIEIAHARRNGSFNKDFVSDIVLKNNVEIVVIFRRYFEEVIPSEWIEVGRWVVPSNNVTVSFFAPNASLEEDAIVNLQDFSRQLRPTVEQFGAYVAP
jgi:hypothetical protein